MRKCHEESATRAKARARARISRAPRGTEESQVKMHSAQEELGQF